MAQQARNKATSHQTPRSDDVGGDWPDSEPEVETRQHAKAKRGLPTEYDSTYTNYPSQYPKPYVDSYGPYATQAGGQTVPYNPPDYFGKPGPAPPQAAPYQPPPPPPPPHPNPTTSTMNVPGLNPMNQGAYQNPYSPNMPPYDMNGLHPSQYANNIPPSAPPPSYFQPNSYSYPATTHAQAPYPNNGGAYYGNYPSVPPKGVSSFGGPPVNRPKARRVKTEAAPSRQQYNIEQVNQKLDDLFLDRELDREQQRARRAKRKKEAAQKAEMAKNVERVREDMEKTFGTKIDELRRELQMRDLELRYEPGRRSYAPTEFSRPSQSVYGDLNSTLGRGDEMANLIEARRRYERQNQTESHPASVLSSQRDPRMALERRATLDTMQDSELVRSTIQDLQHRLYMMEQRDINRQQTDARQPHDGASRRPSSSRRARSDSQFSTYRDGESGFMPHPYAGQSEDGDRRHEAQPRNTEAYWAGTYRKPNRAAGGRAPHHPGSHNSAPPLKSAMRANGSSKRRESSYETNETSRAARAAMNSHMGHGMQPNPTYQEVFDDDDEDYESDIVSESPELFPKRDATYPSMYKGYPGQFYVPAAPEARMY